MSKTCFFFLTMDYTCQRYSESLLHYAARINNYHLMKELLTRGDVNVNTIEVILSRFYVLFIYKDPE